MRRSPHPIRPAEDDTGSLDAPEAEPLLDLDLVGESAPATTSGDDVFVTFADEVSVRELQAELRTRVELEREVLVRRKQLEGVTGRVSRIHLTDLAAGEVGTGELELEDEFWAEGSTMSSGWLLRRKRREEQEAAIDDEPMEMIDLSAYDVPPERRGAFRDAVAAGSERDNPSSWATTTGEKAPR